MSEPISPAIPDGLSILWPLAYDKVKGMHPLTFNRPVMRKFFQINLLKLYQLDKSFLFSSITCFLILHFRTHAICS